MNRLLLNKEIYNTETINKAQKDFKQLAVIEHEMDEVYHVLTFSECYHDEWLTKSEFENYVVNLMVSRNG